MPFTYEFPRPSVCVDCVVFGLSGPCAGSTANVKRQSVPDLDVLLIERANPPFAGMWALPGGFVEIEEPLETAAFRELHEETGIRPAALEFAGVYGAPGRDPRGRTISVVYRTVVWKDQHTPQGGDDAKTARWFPVAALPAMAFDHSQIVPDVLTEMRYHAATRPFGKAFLPREFSWQELFTLYQGVLGYRLSSRRLRTFLEKCGVVKEVSGSREGELPLPQRQAGRKLYRFDDEVYDRLTQTGFVPAAFAPVVSTRKCQSKPD